MHSHQLMIYSYLKIVNEVLLHFSLDVKEKEDYFDNN